jgi:hypothetical protein
VKAEKLLPVPLQQLAPGKLQNKIGVALPAGMAIPSPAGIAVRRGRTGAMNCWWRTISPTMFC